MAYEIGTAENTFDLYYKLRTFMTTIEGWQIWSNIDGYDGYDIVYYSQGSNGNTDIFIRHRARLTEQFLYGLDQFDYTGQGDTGYINFFTYGHFPQDGDAYSGVTELGSFGPRLYYFVDNSDSNNTLFQHILSQQPGGTSAGSTDVGSGDYRSLQSFVRSRWSQPNDTLLSEWNFTPDEQICFDGKRYFYYSYNSAGRIFRYTVERTHGGNSGYGGTFGSTGNEIYGDVKLSDGTRRTGLVVVEHRDTRQQYLYMATEGTSTGGGFQRMRLDDNSFTLDTSLAEPSWPTRTYSTFFGSSNDSTSNNGHMAWDGGDHIYFLRGGFGGANNLSTPDWGMYTISTNTWRVTESPNNPSFPVLPVSTGSFTTHWFLFVNKIISGFTYNRLYIVIGSGVSGVLYYLDLHSDTGMPIQTVWQTQTITRQMASNVFSSANRYAITRSQKFFVFSSTAGTRTTPDDIFAIAPDAGIFYTDLKETGSIQFNTTDITTLPERSDNQGSHYFFADGYAARVRTSLSDSTDYIFIGDADRIIVATKSDNKWSMCYMGAFDSTFGTEPSAEIAEDVSAGVSVRIPLRNIRGTFVANSNYTIVGTSQNPEPTTHRYYGFAKRFMPSEGVVVTHVGDDCVFASIKYDYKAGDRIGIDPQPVGIWMPDLYKFTATNIFPIHYDAFGGSADPSIQTYTTFVDGALVDEGIPSNRELHYIAWAVPISTSSPESSYKGLEDRGTLIGVYSLPVSSTLQPGDTIYISDGGYYIVQVENTTTKYAIGPLR